MPSPVNQLDLLDRDRASFDLWLPPYDRGAGLGFTMLADLCEQADDLAVELHIWAEPDFDLCSPDQLARWYERFGFERTGEVRPGAIRMVRGTRDHG